MSLLTKKDTVSSTKNTAIWEKIVKVFDEYMQALNTIEESDEIIADGSDKDFVELAKIEKKRSFRKNSRFGRRIKSSFDSKRSCR